MEWPKTDLVENFRRLLSADFVRVYVTWHALARLRERKVKDYMKLDRVTIKNIVANTVRDGKFWFSKNGDIKIATKKYTLACTVQDDMLIVKTIMQTKREVVERSFRRKHETSWKQVLVSLPERKINKFPPQKQSHTVLNQKIG